MQVNPSLLIIALFMIFNFQFRHFCVVQVNGASNQPVWSKAPKSCFEQDWSRLPIETLPMQHFKQPELLLDPGPGPLLAMAIMGNSTDEP